MKIDLGCLILKKINIFAYRIILISAINTSLTPINIKKYDDLYSRLIIISFKFYKLFSFYYELYSFIHCLPKCRQNKPRLLLTITPRIVIFNALFISFQYTRSTPSVHWPVKTGIGKNAVNYRSIIIEVELSALL